MDQKTISRSLKSVYVPLHIFTEFTEISYITILKSISSNNHK